MDVVIHAPLSLSTLPERRKNLSAKGNRFRNELSSSASWLYAATNVSETKTRNTIGHRRLPPEKSGYLLRQDSWLQVVHGVRRSGRITRLPSLCAPLLSGTIIKSSEIEYIRRITHALHQSVGCRKRPNHLIRSEMCLPGKPYGEAVVRVWTAASLSDLSVLRPHRIGALQKLFENVGASKEALVPKPFRRNAPQRGVGHGVSASMLDK
jgi:hypothetical protein